MLNEVATLGLVPVAEVEGCNSVVIDRETRLVLSAKVAATLPQLRTDLLTKAPTDHSWVNGRLAVSIITKVRPAPQAWPPSTSHMSTSRGGSRRVCEMFVMRNRAIIRTYITTI